jgi:hypothetical protein
MNLLLPKHQQIQNLKHQLQKLRQSKINKCPSLRPLQLKNKNQLLQKLLKRKKKKKLSKKLLQTKQKKQLPLNHQQNLILDHQYLKLLLNHNQSNNHLILLQKINLNKKILKNQLIQTNQAKMNLMMMKMIIKIGGTGDLIFNKILPIKFRTMKTKTVMQPKKEQQINLNH